MVHAVYVLCVEGSIVVCPSLKGIRENIEEGVDTIQNLKHLT